MVRLEKVNILSYRQELDLRRGDDLIRLGVAIIALDGKFRRVSIGAKNLQRAVGAKSRGFGGRILGDGNFEIVRPAAVSQTGGAVNQQTGGFFLHDHLRDQILIDLKLPIFSPNCSR